MLKTLEDMQKFGRENIDATLQSFDLYTKNVRAIAQEVADYSQRSLAEGTEAAERLFGSTSLDSAVEVQNGYAKRAYEGFVAQSSKLGSLYVDLARETYKPFEGRFKATAAR